MDDIRINLKSDIYQDHFNLYEVSFIEIIQVYYAAVILPIKDCSIAYLKSRKHT